VLGSLVVVSSTSAVAAKAKEVVDTDATVTTTFTTCNASLDPHATASYLSEFLYDELIGIDKNKVLQPGLAESWTTSKDRLSITLKLRKGVSFVDGSSFDSTAATASLERSRTMAATSSSLSTIASVEAPDASTVVLHLTQPDSSLLFTLATPFSGRVVSPKAIAAKTNLTLSDQGAGSTGYKVVSFANPGANAKLIVERVPGFKYWDPKMWRVKRYEITCGVLEPSGQVTGAKSGSFDYVNANALTPAELKTGVAGAANVTVVPFGGFRYQDFSLNQTMFPDVKVRTAIMQSIDFVSLSKSGAIPGLDCSFATQNQILLPGSPGYVKNFKSPLDYSAKAKAAAATLLMPLHLNFDLYYRSARADAQAQAEFVQAQLKDVGVTVNLKVLPSAQLGTQYVSGLLPAMLFALNSGADSGTHLNTLLGPSAGHGAAGPAFTSQVKPKIDEINALPAGSEARAQKLAEVNKFVADQAWWRPFCGAGYAVAVKTSLRGVTDMPMQWTTQNFPRTLYVVKAT
jgi:peptide/nickel transport system substrate-binding protein